MVSALRATFLIAVVALSGCAVTSTVKLYDGPERDTSQIASLYIDPHVVVTRVDDVTEHPGDKSRALAHSAGKRREIIALAAGKHELHARFFVLCLRSESEISLTFMAEAGKKYRLKSIVDPDYRKWRPEIVEYDGSEIEDTISLARVMCKPNIFFIRLSR